MVATSVGTGKFSVSIGKTPFTTLDQSFSVKVSGGAIGAGGWVGVGVTEGVGVGVCSGDGDGEGVGVGVTTGVGFLITTPLFQTSFVPDLMQVNFFPPEVAVDPALVHLAPALGAAALSGVASDRSSATVMTRRNFFGIVMVSSLCPHKIGSLTACFLQQSVHLCHLFQ